MVTLDYVFKDLTRRRTQTITILICLALSVASVTFLTLIGVSVRVDLTLTHFMWRMSAGLNYLFSRYLTIVVLLSVAIGVVVLFNIMITTTAQRRRDIGIMKAIGLAGEVGSFFVAESAITVLAGCAVGILLGIVTYTVLILFLSAMGFALPMIFPLNLLFGIFISCFLISFAFMYLSLNKAVVGMKAVEAIGHRQTRSRRLEFKWKTGFLLKIPLRTLEDEGGKTLMTMTSCGLCLMLLSILIFGGQVITSTANTYVQRGVGENILLVAAPKMAAKYEELLSFQGFEDSELDYLSEDYAIGDGFVEWLESQPWVICVDPRIIVKTEVFEMAYIEPIPGPAYKIIGGDRSAEALVVGVKAEQLTSDWVHIGNILNNDAESGVLMGDSMLDIVYDFNLEKLNIFSISFSIVGVCIDPLNRGYTIYMPFDRLTAILNVMNPNILLVKAEKAHNTFLAFQQKALEYELSVIELNNVLEENIATIQRLWTTISVLPSMALVSMAISLMNYLTSKILGRIPDFKVMRGMGVKWSNMKKMITIKVSILVVPCCSISIVVGFLFVMNFLVPYPTIPPYNILLLNAIALGTAVLIIIAGSVLFSIKLLRQLTDTV